MKKEFKAHLKEQITFLSRSAAAFDEGFESEAKRMAVVIRIFIHDTKFSTSLLTHLKKKDILFYDTANEYDPYNLAPTIGLVCMQCGPEGAKYIAPLDDNIRVQNKKVPFEKWWEKIVIADTKGNKLTRKDLILSITNKDGGAHIDKKLDEDYANLIKLNTIGWKYFSGELEGNMQGAELASVRQITYELLKSLKNEFPECFK